MDPTQTCIGDTADNVAWILTLSYFSSLFYGCECPLIFVKSILFVFRSNFMVLAHI